MSETTLSPVIERVGDRATGQLVPAKVAQMLSLSLEGVAGLVRIHRNTLTRSPSSPQVQEGLGEVVRIIAKAGSLLADPQDVDAAVLWFRHHPIAAFGAKTAEELVREGRVDAVAKHLEAVADGVYA